MVEAGIVVMARHGYYMITTHLYMQTAHVMHVREALHTLLGTSKCMQTGRLPLKLLRCPCTTLLLTIQAMAAHAMIALLAVACY